MWDNGGKWKFERLDTKNYYGSFLIITNYLVNFIL
jgi:hypothetical protein